VHESIILPSPPPTCTARIISILLHVVCAIYDAPPDPPFVCHTTYNIGNNNILYNPNDNQEDLVTEVQVYMDLEMHRAYMYYIYIYI